MKILILLAALTGCTNRVTVEDFKKAERVCEAHGGLHHLATFLGPNAVCNITKEGDFRVKAL